MGISKPSYIACPDCDSLFTTPEVGVGERILCPRCGANLFSPKPDFANRASALVFAAVFFFLLANAFPFIGMQEDYRESQMRLAGSVSGLEQDGYPILGGMVGVFTIAAPGLVMAALIYILLPLRRGRRLPWALPLCRAMYEARRWNMVEVFLLGVLVSLMKLGKLAKVSLGVSFWAYVGLIMCLAAALAAIDHRELWERLEAAEE